MKNNWLYRKKTINRIIVKNDYLGKNYDVILFLNIRLLICLCIFIGISIISYSGLIISPLITIITYYLIEYLFFDIRIVNRKKIIEKDALVYFNLFAINLSDNIMIYKLLETIGKIYDSELSKEINKALFDSNHSKSLKDSLTLLKKRIPSDNVNNILTAIIDSNGNNELLAKSLVIQLEHLKNNKQSDLRSQINLIPIKMNLISLLFIILLSSLIYYLVYLLKIA